MDTKIGNQLRIFIIISFLLMGLGLISLRPAYAMEVPKPPTNVTGSYGHIYITSNAIGYPAGDPHIGYLKPVPGKCTDQPVFAFTGTAYDNNLFSIGVDEQGTYLDHLEYDLGRDEFEIHVSLVCFLEGYGEIGYEDIFIIYVAPQLNIGSDMEIKVGDTFAAVGSFTDPGPEDNWNLYVNYGDAPGEYEAGWELLDFNPYYRDFELYHNYAHDGLYQVSVRVVNERGHIGENSIQLTVLHSPIADAGGPYSLPEHSDVMFDASGSFDPQEYILVSYEWDFNGDGYFDDAVGVKPVANFPDDNGGPFTIKVKVTNSEGQFDTDTATVYVTNVSPAVEAGASAAINEGQTFTGSGSFNDPGHDIWTATVNYDDGSGPQTLSLNAGKTFTLSHQYTDNGTYTVTVTVADDDGGIGSDTLTVTVNNQAPTVDAGANNTIKEGETFSGSGYFNDPGADNWTATVKYCNECSVQTLALDSSTFNLSHKYADNGVYTVTVEITDDDEGKGTDTLTVTVNNVEPTVSTITAPPTALTGEPINFSASFTDDGVLDTHTATWNWGDSTTGTGSITEAGGSGKVLGTHIYTSAGDYSVTVTVEDKDGASKESTPFAIWVNTPPVAVITTYSEWIEGGTYGIRGDFSYDPDENDVITSYEWDLDGDWVFDDASDKELVYSLYDDGSYPIRLKVTDSHGESNIASKTVTVTNLPPVFFIPYGDYFIELGQIVNIPIRFADQGDDTWVASITYGDGTNETTSCQRCSPYPADYIPSDCQEGSPLVTSFSHTYSDIGTYNVALTVEDDDGGLDEYALRVYVAENNNPVVNISADAISIDEGGAFTGSGSFTDLDSSGWSAEVDYGDGSGAQTLALSGNSFTLNHNYADSGTYNVTVTVTDNNGSSGSDTLTVTVNNVAPTVVAGWDFTINPGQTIDGEGSFTDPGADAWTATVDFGDGSVQALSLNGKSFDLNHQYDAGIDDGTYLVTITVNDGDGGVGSDTLNVAVDSSVVVDQYMTLKGWILFPGGFGLPCGYFSICTGGLEFRLPEGVADNDLFAITNHFNSEYPEQSYAELTFKGPADNSRTDYTIQVELVCTRADGTQETYSGSFTITVQVSNTAPIFTLTSPLDGTLYKLGEMVTINGNINDPDSSDIHTYHVNWDDDSSGDSLDHQYSAAGVYSISIHVEDNNGGISPTVQVMVVVYDPSTGFVTGGGWIDSPAGAFMADPSLTGKATFGFVSKYKKDADVPTGQTQFQFKVADLNFHSSSYEWLVVAGAKAMYKGVGTINGEGEYKFMLSAIDADINDNDSFDIDRFRIKIWEESPDGTEVVVYDNGLGGGDEDDDFLTEIGGGSIVVHKAK